MFLNTIITNPNDEEVRVGFIGKGIRILAPHSSTTVPYDILTACKTAQQKNMLLTSLSNKLVQIQYVTDMPINQVQAREKKAAPKPVKKQPVVVEPVETDAGADVDAVVQKVGLDELANKKPVVDLFGDGEKKPEVKTVRLDQWEQDETPAAEEKTATPKKAPAKKAGSKQKKTAGSKAGSRKKMS